MAEKTLKHTGSALFEEAFQNIRKAAESSLSMQQEMFSQWSALLPGMPAPQSTWMKQLQQVRSKWSDAVAELARKHREVIDRQYAAALESLDAALCVTDASTPEEFRRRSEQLCRKSLDCVREVAESQVQEFQDAVAKWTEVFGKSPS
ncbi:MAG TPA: hypothetical protein PKC18_09390 [Lacipirellulaceae bacterium]|nr:hypothetical protein [Lacipirellulaceae bacterium]HMP05883.1 hypothetical protein [Lacipirellulaceae bacterium]